MRLEGVARARGYLDPLIPESAGAHTALCRASDYSHRVERSGYSPSGIDKRYHNIDYRCMFIEKQVLGGP